MTRPPVLEKDIFNSDINFEESALQVFHFQARENAVYKRYIEQLKINPAEINSVHQIPFLPIQFFKSHEIITASKPQTVFLSSGTTGTERSRHYVADLKIYEQSFLKCFELFYGNVNDYCILALLPSYLENGHSSLVYMAHALIRKSGNALSGFYLDEFEKLSGTILQLIDKNQKFILLGVTYAMLDFAERVKSPPKGFNGLGIIMETGGMKGKRQEMVREEVHRILCDAYGVQEIHSEYGMTELLSQAYSKGNGIFSCPPWMKIFIRDINDPSQLISNEKTGGINVIDLANVYSCSFIATQDLGKKYGDACLPDRQGSFEVLGRFDNSELRGCNLMIE